MKIFTLSPNEGWILDRIAAEWKTLRPDITTDNIAEADVIWFISPYQWRAVSPSLLQKKKVVVTIHHIVKEKFTRDSLAEFLARDKYVDTYHVPCQKTKDFISQITKKPIVVIGYWYNSKIWSPISKEKAREKMNISSNRYVIGSFQRDTEGHDLKSPKLEKGPDIFVETVKKINKKNLLVLLGGWRRQYIMRKLKEESIDYKFIEMAPLETLRDMYACCDLYIVSSRTEGGPQAVLEAAAMKIPIISTNVGMAKDTLIDNCIINMPSDIYIPSIDDVEYCYEKVEKYEMHEYIKEYVNFFQNVLGE
jgi:glycosyltransferase involved in cell wall biosynthesis